MANPIVEQVKAELETLQNELGQFKSTVAYLSGAKNNVTEAIDVARSTESLLKKKAEDLKSSYEGMLKLHHSLSELLTKVDEINFPQRLDSIESGFSELLEIQSDIKGEINNSIKKLDQQIDKIDFHKRFSEIQKEVSKVVGSNDKVIDDIKKLNIQGLFLEFEKSMNKKLDDSNTSNKKLISDSISDLQKNTKQIAAETAKSILDINIPTRMDKLDANIAGILTAIQNVQGRIESLERNIGEKIKDSSDKHTATLNALQEKINKSFEGIQADIKANFRKQQTNTYITWGAIVVATALVIIYCKN